MASVNKVQLIGHLGRDPETRTFSNGGKVCSLRIATSETWKDRNTGERKERTEWHSVSLLAEHAVNYAEKYLRKGSKVYIEGKLETRKWQDQSGQDRYSTEVVVRPYGGEVIGLDKAQNDSRGQSGGYDGSPSGQQNSAGGYGGAGGIGDDDIPFAPEVRV